MKSTSRKHRVSPGVESLEGRALMAAPVLDAIPLDTGAVNLTLPALKSRLVPLTATDADGDTLSYSVTSSNPNIKAQVLTGGTFLKMTYAGYGDLTFRLLPEFAPETSRIMGGLAADGKFDGLTLHRIIAGFVIQGGDPTGTGSGSLLSYKYGDEFHPDALFTGRGQLAMANSGEDTNGSQFFVTVGQPRHLDFKHTIFGQLVRGFSVLDQLNLGPQGTVITSATLIQDPTDAILVVNATGAGSSTLTVTANDGRGGTSSRSVNVATFTDSTNNKAILYANGPTATSPGVPISPFAAIDLEGNPFTVTATVTDNPAHATVQFANNLLTVTPEPGYVGEIHVQAKVSQGAPATVIDTKTFTVYAQALESQGVNQTVNEGAAINGTVATFTSAIPFTAANFKATINWGDGSAPTAGVVQAAAGGPAGSYVVIGSKTYNRFGSRGVSIAISDLTTGFTTNAQATANVVDAPLIATFIPHSPEPGTGEFNGAVAVFADANPMSVPSDLSATIAWGDGNNSNGIVLRLPDGSYAVFASKVYGALGAFDVTVTINSLGGASATANGKLTVLNRAPTITQLPELTADEGSNVSLDLASGSGDPDPGQTLTYSLSQGGPALATIEAATGRFQWTAGGSDETFTVVATDSGTPQLQASRSFTIKVRGVAPTVDAGSSITISQFDTIARSGQFTDTGGGPWTATVDYGDGSGRQPLPLSADKTFALGHTYATAGSFTASIEVTDATGMKGTATVPVVVTAVPVVRFISATFRRQKKAIIGFDLRLDGAIDAITAANVTNYSIVSAGRDRKFGTRDDIVTRLRAASPGADGRTIQLSTLKKLVLSRPMQLRANGLKDTFGRLLDGDRDGNPGGIFAATIAKARLTILGKK